jgi:hypothetical protein
MTTISDLVNRFADDERPVGNLLDVPTLLAQAIAATNFHAGYANLAAHLALPIADPPPDPPTPYPAIDGTTELNVSEWALIRPLFLLYVEREEARQLEASRGMGIDVFGRSTAEIEADITQKHLEYPHLAFIYEVETV